jgi:hypothetical protein
MQCKCGAEIGPWRKNKDGTLLAKCSGCTRVVKRWVTAGVDRHLEPSQQQPRTPES